LAVKVVKTLRASGHEAYFAGGCVRDMVMHREPADYDVATSATPDQVRRLFPRTIPVGEQFGVVVVVEEGLQVEIATFRTDGPYTDGRHPATIAFTDVEGDVRRRDFTVNGMMYDPVDEKLIDLVGGRKDIEARLIRAIGEPRKRFEEDRLRLVRAVRFAARFGFTIEPATRSAIVDLASQIVAVSPERIAAELRFMLTDRSRAVAVRLLDDLGLLRHILPEVVEMKGVAQSEDWHPEGDVFVHTLRCLEGAGEARWELVLAALLHDVGKPGTADAKGFAAHEKTGAEMTEEICRRLRLSNRECEEVGWLVKNHMRFRDARKMKVSTLKKLMSEPLFEDLAELHRIDAQASAGDLETYRFVMDEYRKFREEKPPMKPMVSGDDLLARGLKPGPAFKEILDEVYNAQLEGKFPDRDGALVFLDDVLRRRSVG
jgi:poly(A) polymerase